MAKAPRSRTILWVLLGLASLCNGLRMGAAPKGGIPQNPQTSPVGEVVANLAAGSVIVAVVKGAILVATIENPIEADTHPPIPVELRTDRLGVILGAVEWISPPSQQEIGRLDKELPRLRSRTIRETPSLQSGQGGAEATDLEVTGEALRERLNDLAQYLHSKIALPPREPIAELILTDYLGGYGPEVWKLTYQIKQTENKDNYWNTEVEKPVFVQLWPPEKKTPHTLMQFSYPPEDASPMLLDVLKQKDPRLQKIIYSDSKMAVVATQFLQGQSEKISAPDAVQFMRALLMALASPQTRETMAIIDEQTGFQWIIQPPAEATKPDALKPSSPGAPTLRSPSNR